MREFESNKQKIAQPKQGVLVLGMHRSGTSAISSAFESAGYFAGNQEDLIPGGTFNPLGHFERKSTAAFFDSLLNELGFSWFNPPPHDQETPKQNVVSEKVAKYFSELRTNLSQESSKEILLKDPRFCLFFPAINGALKSDFLNVFVFRNPLEVAASLSVRDGIPIAVGLDLWEVYMSSLLPSLIKVDFVAIDFDELVRDSNYALMWQTKHKYTFSRMGLNLPNFTTINSQYKHHNIDEQMLSQRLTKPIAEIWELCKNISKKDANKEVVFKTSIETRQSLQKFAELYQARSDALVQRDDALVQRDDALVQRDDALVQRDDALVQRDDALEALLEIRNSKTWRYTSWFRSVARYFQKNVSS